MKSIISKYNIAKAVFGLALGVGTLTSCSEDFLERIPTDAVSSDIFWKTETDADLALTGCYRQLYSPYRPEERWFWDTASDNAFCYHSNKDWRSIGNGTMAASGISVHNYFTYTQIRTCNEYLQKEKTIEFSSDAKRNQYRAEVRMIRALCLFFRVETYGDFPFSEDVYETLEESKVGRVDKNTLLEYIHTELVDILQYLPEGRVEPGRICKAAAQAFLVRLDMYLHNYTEAIKYAQDIMTDGTFSMPKLSYDESFWKSNENNSEVIMSFEHNKAGGFAMWIAEYFPNSYGGWSSVVPTRELLDSYETKNGLTIMEDPTYDAKNPFVNRDPRLRATILYPGQVWGNYTEASGGYKSCEKGSGDYWSDADNATKTGMNFKKFYSNLDDFDDIWSCDRNFPMFRYAEILLSYAEAKIETGSIDESVYNAINQVRERAGMPKVDRGRYSDQATLRTLVRRERRVEFAYEGMRRYDLIRWGELGQALNGQYIYHMNGKVTSKLNAEGDFDVEIDPIVKGTDYVEKRNFTTNKNELLPVPQTVIDVNPLITQNPGY